MTRRRAVSRAVSRCRWRALSYRRERNGAIASSKPHSVATGMADQATVGLCDPRRMD